MNKINKKDVLDIYPAYLRKYMSVCKLKKNVFKMTFPFLDKDLDCIELYAIYSDKSCYITDDGVTLSNTEYNSKISSIITQYNDLYDINLTNNGELSAVCTLSTLSLKMHALLQCIIKINTILEFL